MDYVELNKGLIKLTITNIYHSYIQMQFDSVYEVEDFMEK